MDQGDASPADYTVPPNVTFATGEMEKMLTFSATQDTDDDDESMLLAFGTLPIGVSAGTTAETTVSITDNNNPQVTVSFGQAAYTVQEGGAQSVTVTLNAEPERPVTIPLTATDQREATYADYSVPTSVTFDARDTEQTITFSATDDPEEEDGEGVLLGFGANLPDRVSAGTQDETTVDITDDDVPGLTVTPSAISVVQGRSARYAVVLDTRPTGDGNVTVTIPPESDNPEVTLSPDELTFTPDNWNSRQRVTVSAPAGSAGQSATITHTVSGYPGVTTVPGVDVTVMVEPPPPVQPATPPVTMGGGGGGSFGGGGSVVITPPPATTGGGGAPLNRPPEFTYAAPAQSVR